MSEAGTIYSRCTPSDHYLSMGVHTAMGRPSTREADAS